VYSLVIACRVLLSIYFRKFRFSVTLFATNSFGDFLLQIAFLSGLERNKPNDLIVYAPIIKKTKKSWRNGNSFLFDLASEILQVNGKVVSGLFIVRVINILSGNRYRSHWNRIFPKSQITTFISKYGVVTGYAKEFQIGIKKFRQSKILAKGQNEVRDHFNLFENERLLVICQKLDGLPGSEGLKPSGAIRTSPLGRFDEVALVASEQDYKVILVGDRDSHILSNSSKVINYAHSNRSDMFDVVIPTLATCIIGNPFGASDMRLLSETTIPFFMVDGPLQLIYTNPDIRMVSPRRIFLRDTRAPASILELFTNDYWTNNGWSEKAHSRYFSEISTQAELLADFKTFLESIQAKDSVTELKEGILKQKPKGSNLCSHFQSDMSEDFSGNFSPSFLSKIQNTQL